MNFIFRKLFPIILISSIIKEIENLTEYKTKTFTDLQNKIDNLEGNKLDLLEHYVFDPKVDKPTGIIIKKPLIMDGKAFHIDGANQTKIFTIYNTEVSIRAGFFMNGFSEDVGGAITLINSTLHLIISDFSYNSANSKGGGIYLNNSFLNITDCVFKYNYVKSNYLSGGGIYSENSRIRINISHLRNNFADEGAAIYSVNSKVDIYNSLIYDNYANYYGGVIVTDSHLFINYSRIYNNRCGYKGGVIHTTSSDYSKEDNIVVINISAVFNNSAEYGGVISSSSIKNVQFNATSFYDNQASFGGVISRMSVNNITFFSCGFSNNIATKGGVIYSVAGGNNYFISAGIGSNKADIGGIVYSTEGRASNKIANFITNFTGCGLSNNYGKKGLIYTSCDNLIITGSSITYLNKSYDTPIIYKIVKGNVTLERNWYGENKPDLNKLIVYEYKNINNNNKINDKNLRSDGCASTVIQIDDNNYAFTFRKDSTKLVYVNIEYQNDGILQFETNQTYFWHTILTKNGWVIGNGGSDSPQSCEKLEAYGKIMAKKNMIIDELINNALQIKSMRTYGHYFVKSPNGTYALVIYNKSLKKAIIEKGKLNSGEYIICPNDYDFYRKGKISDLKINGNYTYISRYLAAIDEYSSQRTNEFTYNFKKNDGLIDIFISNDDGSLSNKPNSSSYFNDIFINEKYIYGENVPIIMNGMFLDRYQLPKPQPKPDSNTSLNLKMNMILLLLFIWFLFL